MRRLHLKLFFLRTRKKREAQGTTAKTLGVRPATMSHLEQGRSLPTLPMLLALCKHYSVNPTYLLDDGRPIEPQSRDQWQESGAVLCRGDWLEVPEGAAIKTADGVLLCPIMSGARFFDSTAQARRMLCKTNGDAERLAQGLRTSDETRDKELEGELQKELLAQRKPRHQKGKPRAAVRKPGAAAPSSEKESKSIELDA